MKIDPVQFAKTLFKKIKTSIDDLPYDDAAATLDELLLVIDEERDRLEDRLDELEDEDTD